MHIFPYDYFNDSETLTTGLARTASLIRSARQEEPNSILLDNGDFLTGTPSGDGLAYAARKIPQALPDHPMITVMHELGYDAVNLGNHDFDHGLEFVRAVAAQARFPVLSANALKSRAMAAAKDETLFAPFTLLDRDVSDQAGNMHRLRIGILGLLPPLSVPQFRSNPHPVLTRDIIETTRARVPQMRAQGADIVVVLAHSGIAGAEYQSGMENAAIPLTREAGIDAIVAGHTHQLFPGPVPGNPPGVDPLAGTINLHPVVSPGHWGAHLGLIDLELGHDRKGWRVLGHQSRTRAIFQRGNDGKPKAQVAPDPAITRIMEPLHKRTLQWIRKPVGRTNTPLHSFFALAAPSSAVQFVQRAQSWFVSQRLSGFDSSDTPLLSSACPFKCGGLGGPWFYTNVAAGDLTLLSIADLYPFPNDLGIISLTGEGVRDWLERSASVFNRIRPGQPGQCLKAHETPCYFYETVLGVSYEINLTRAPRYTPNGALIDPNAARIRNLRHAGKPVRADQRFTLITNGYRLGGGGHYPGTDPISQLPDLSVPMRDVLMDYARHHPDIDLTPEPHWQFSAAGGAGLWFRSSPRARVHLGELAGLDITAQRHDHEGFLHFGLTL